MLTNLSEIGTGTNNITSVDPALTGTYCNGSLVPVEGATSVPGSPYAGWLAPPGTNESNGLPAPPFTLQAAGTVDEGNNWINLRWGPLSTNVLDGSANAVFTFDPRQQAGSPVIDYIPVGTANTPNNIGGVPTLDFYGHARPDTSTANHPRFDIGAVEYQAAVTTPILVVTPSPVAFGNVVASTTPAPTQTITLRNDGGATATGIAVGTIAAGSPFTRSGTTCGTTLLAGATCTITITFNPTTTGNFSASLNITSTNATVNGAPVPISGTGVAAIRTATVSPSPLNFGSWPTGTTVNPMALTVTNTGNVPLTGGTFAVNPVSTHFVRSTTNPGSCTGTLTLNVGASCTVNVVFTPGATGGTFNGALPVTFAGGAVVSGSPVSLNGTAVSGRAALVIAPNPVTITVPAGTLTGGATVTLTNTQPLGGI